MNSTPLAERLRPQNIEDLVGQGHLLGPNGALTGHILRDHIPSMILWGPPGVGKTTLANIIANTCKRQFYSLSAINSGVKDVRAVIEGPAFVHITDRDRDRPHRHWNIGWLYIADMDAPLSKTEGARWFSCSDLPEGPRDLHSSIALLLPLISH